jgi:hypothetical protein
MENPTGLPQGLDSAERCPHTHEPLRVKRLFLSFFEQVVASFANWPTSYDA